MESKAKRSIPAPQFHCKRCDAHFGVCVLEKDGSPDRAIMNKFRAEGWTGDFDTTDILCPKCNRWQLMETKLPRTRFG